MERNEIFSRLEEVFRDVLDNDEIVLTDTTTADDIEEWDSLTHIQLIVAIEKTFQVKFTSKEILSWKNVGELADCIQSK
ncbi:MAG: acyl carrier protein [Bacteroidales bacterium]|nr:acyl carrier protein [Bacteroidales bacterium]MBR0300506.1 acyl carrier protein [Bacteroidales bacterium]